MEYSTSTTSSFTVVRPQEDSDWEKVNNIISFLAYWSLSIYTQPLTNFMFMFSFFMQKFLAFDGVDNDAQKTQLELYLDKSKYLDKSATFDILSFWKGNEFRYPEVVTMARDILSIHISTVTSESTFSTGERVIDQYRSSLKPDIVEALVCTRDWLYGEQSNISYLHI